MEKSALTIRLGEPELNAIDRFVSKDGLTRSRVIEAIIQDFSAQSDAEQRAALSARLNARRTKAATDESITAKRWGTV